MAVSGVAPEASCQIMINGGFRSAESQPASCLLSEVDDDLAARPA